MLNRFGDQILPFPIGRNDIIIIFGFSDIQHNLEITNLDFELHRVSYWNLKKSQTVVNKTNRYILKLKIAVVC